MSLVDVSISDWESSQRRGWVRIRFYEFEEGLLLGGECTAFWVAATFAPRLEPERGFFSTTGLPTRPDFFNS